VATLANWACNFSLTFFTPPAFQHIQWRVYMIFGTFCVTAFVHVFFFFQESRGMSLEEMDNVFDNNTFAFGNVQVSEKMLAERIKEVEALKNEGLDASKLKSEFIENAERMT
jgi:hypothetical protein